ncbi:hypothetical protein J5N97_030309 [Dioscorea zingiberensis]|uniref:Uncharacterized protein n=1 Tax=Dioscorea zingiberensis TaxID=325984 RepID=A0A9D5BX83_9LILI|nr:hypothetical protein J5N97_030309 [Dioscorea zingiberensis]
MHHGIRGKTGSLPHCSRFRFQPWSSVQLQPNWRPWFPAFPASCCVSWCTSFGQRQPSSSCKEKGRTSRGLQVNRVKLDLLRTTGEWTYWTFSYSDRVFIEF